MRNPLISLTLWTIALGAAMVAACSAPDPGVGYLGLAHSNTGGENSPSASADSGAPVAPSSPSGPTSNPTPSPTSGGTPDAGPPVASTDAGKPSGGGSGDGGGGGDAGSTAATFLGEATPWASSPVATGALAAHSAVGQAPQSPTTPCLSCHVTGGPGAPFLAAGFVATSAGGTTGAGDVEVRVYAQGGTAAGYSAHTDSDGFFWINPPNGGTTGPYQGGVRNGTTTLLMPAAQSAANCQSCHAGATGVIHLP